MNPTRREWLDAWLDGLERSRFTGTARLTLFLIDGSLTRLAVEEAVAREIPVTETRR